MLQLKMVAHTETAAPLCPLEQYLYVYLCADLFVYVCLHHVSPTQQQQGLCLHQ